METWTLIIFLQLHAKPVANLKLGRSLKVETEYLIQLNIESAK